MHIHQRPLCSRRPSARRSAARAASVRPASSRRSATGRSATASANSPPMRIGFRIVRVEQARRGDARLAAQPAGFVHRQAGHHDAVEQHAPAGGHHAAIQRDQPTAIDHQACRPGALSTTSTRFGARFRMSPSSIIIGTAPHCCASSACACRWRHSPCTGTHSAASPAGTAGAVRRAPDGRRRAPDGRHRSSGARRGAPGCPAPCRSPARSPGCTREEKITVSPSPSATRGWVSIATRASALRGSPWLPVIRISRLSSGTSSISSSPRKGGMPFR